MCEIHVYSGYLADTEMVMLLQLTVQQPDQNDCWQSRQREAGSTLHLPHHAPLTQQDAT